MMDETTQRILTQTYVLSRIRYASSIVYPHIAKSARKNIESAIRSMVRDVFNTSQSANTGYFTLFTSHVPLGLKAMQGKMKILSKMKQFYPEELEAFEELMGDLHWKNQVKNYCPQLEQEDIDKYDLSWVKKNTSAKNKPQSPEQRLTKIEQLYISKYHDLVDPDQPEKLKSRTDIFFDQRKHKYLSYAFLRNHYYEWSNVDCESCKQSGHRHNPFMNRCS